MQTVIEELRNSYEDKYKKWCLKNPGYVMCNYACKCDTLNTILQEHLSLEQIIEKEQWHRDLYAEMEGLNGHYICAEVLKELIELIKNEEKNRGENNSG